MEKLQARKKVYLWLLILLSLCALIPLAVLSKYNHQSGDDYGYAYRTFQIWRETHSFWNVIKEAFATSAEFYQKWQGLYASAVLLALEAPFGVAFSVLFAEEAPTPFMYLGFALIFVAVVCSETKFDFLRRVRTPAES